MRQVIKHRIIAISTSPHCGPENYRLEKDIVIQQPHAKRESCTTSILCLIEISQVPVNKTKHALLYYSHDVRLWRTISRLQSYEIIS